MSSVQENYCFHVAARSTESGIMQPHRDPNDILCPSCRNTFEAAAPSWQRSGNVCFGFVTVLSPKSLPNLAYKCLLEPWDKMTWSKIVEITHTSISEVLKCHCKRLYKKREIKVTHKDGLRNPPKWTSCQFVFFAHEHHKSFSEPLLVCLYI